MLDTKPVVEPVVLGFVQAFYLLDRDRVNTPQGIGCIPLSAIYRYCETNRAYVDDPDFFEEVILEVDAAYVTEVNARIQRRLEQQRGASRG